ncbi:MAG: peptidylprolyl isomerase [Nitrosarchaeum sp.]|nr:peptidylprolyl isomerase [Nitrosarchaeum sp.]
MSTAIIETNLGTIAFKLLPDLAPHHRGIVSMARAQDPNSAGSQFFIVTTDSTFLDRQYTVFGEVIEGMDVADKIVNLQRDRNDCPLEEAKMLHVKVE